DRDTSSVAVCGAAIRERNVVQCEVGGTAAPRVVFHAAAIAVKGCDRTVVPTELKSQVGNACRCVRKGTVGRAKVLIDVHHHVDAIGIGRSGLNDGGGLACANDVD